MLDFVLDIFLSNFQPEKVLSYQKSLFTKAEEEQVELLDNFLRATGIRGYKKWTEVWDCSKVFYGVPKEVLEKVSLQIDTIRLEIVEQLGEFFEEMGNNSWHEII